MGKNRYVNVNKAEEERKESLRQRKINDRLARGKPIQALEDKNKVNPILRVQRGEPKEALLNNKKKPKKIVVSERGKKGELEDVDDITLKDYKQSEVNTARRLKNQYYEGGDEYDNYDILNDALNPPTLFTYDKSDIGSMEILGPDQQHLNKHHITKSEEDLELEEKLDRERNMKGMTPKLSKKAKARNRMQKKLTIAKQIHLKNLEPIEKVFWKDLKPMKYEEQLEIRRKLKINIQQCETSQLLGKLVTNEGEMKNKSILTPIANSANANKSLLPRPITSFQDTSLPKSMVRFIELLQNKHPNIKEPTPIQAQCWSAILTGKDVLSIAQTGSGKTLGYLLPAIPHILAQMKIRSTISKSIKGPIALILVPTRELAQQVETVAKPMRSLFGIHTLAVYGGIKATEQKDILSEEHNELVVATPGRLVDLILKSEQIVGLLGRVTMLIFDEADRMLTLGFGDQLQMISEQIRKDRQTLMFSATFAKDMQESATNWLKDPLKIMVKSSRANEQNTAVITKNVKQVVKVLENDQRQEYLLKFLQSIIDREVSMRNRSLILIFVNQIKNVKPVFNAIEKMLVRQSRKYKVGQIHGDMKQEERDSVVNEFKAGKVTILVATDILSRGIHINNLRFVINYEFPNSLEQVC